MRTLDEILVATKASSATDLFSRYQHWEKMMLGVPLTLNETQTVCLEVNRAAGTVAMEQLVAINTAKVKARLAAKNNAQKGHIVVVGANGRRGQAATERLKELKQLVVGLDVNATDEEWQRYLKHADGAVVVVPEGVIPEVTAKIRGERPDLKIYVAYDVGHLDSLKAWLKE